MSRNPEDVRQEFDREIAAAGTPEAIEEIRVRYVGRKAGLVRSLLQGLGSLPPPRSCPGPTPGWAFGVALFSLGVAPACCSACGNQGACGFTWGNIGMSYQVR